MDGIKREIAKACYPVEYHYLQLRCLPLVCLSQLPIELNIKIHNHRDVSNVVIDIYKIETLLGYHQNKPKCELLDALCLYPYKKEVRDTNSFLTDFYPTAKEDVQIWKVALHVLPAAYPLAPLVIRDNPYFVNKYHTMKLSKLAVMEEHGIDISYYEWEPHTLIIQAIYHVICGADIHAKNDWLLRYTVSHGTLEQVKMLITAHNANFHVVHEGACGTDTCLWRACRLRRKDIVEYLLKSGANPHIAGNHAYRISTQHQFHEITELLYRYQRKPLDEYTLEAFKLWKEKGYTL